jgi:hypothetical protein
LQSTQTRRSSCRTSSCFGARSTRPGPRASRRGLFST